MRYKTILIFGAPGSGKGTQGNTLGTIPRFYHCACGDVFRSLDTRTPVGKKFLEYSSKGQLVPDEVTVQLWQARIEDSVSSHTFKPDIDFLVLDGIPRSVRQAKLMEPLIEVACVFHLSVGDDYDALAVRLQKRALKDNRLDDASMEVIAKRIATYQAESRPLIEYYGPDLVKKIDAHQPPVAVLYNILQILHEEKILPPATF